MEAGKEQGSVFQEAKIAFQNELLLAHYDESKLLVMACDMSPQGTGAIVSDLVDVTQKDLCVVHASRTLSSAEKEYFLLQKETLAIVFGVKKFHNYLFGRHFSIQSDHKPLSYFFNELRGILQIVSARIQRWALTLSAYNYWLVSEVSETL